MPKIPALPPMTSPDGADELPIEDVSVGTTKYITLTRLKEWFQALAGWVTTAMIGDGQVTSTKMTNSEQAFMISRLNTATASATGWQPLPTDTVVASNGCTIASGYKVTVPRAGRYDAGCVLRYASGGTGSRGLRITLYRAGVLVEDQGCGQFLTDPSIFSTGTTLNCQANDVIWFEMYSGTSFTPTGYNNIESGPDRAFVTRLWVSENRA